MNENFNYCHVVGKTDVGRKRAANEDNMFNTITQNGLVSIVCDGMGGHVGGATASKIAVTAIIENLNNVYYDDPRIAIGESIDVANNAIIRRAQEQPELYGMGSTCVMLIVRDGKVYIGHVGDSRIYLIRDRRIVQLTKDHSYVQMLVDHGDITKEQAEHHPRKNEITNALGIPNMSPATVAEDAIIPEAGDCFVLCSDGLSGMVSDDKICKIISRQAEMNAQDRVDRLVELANENGGVDNITIQLVEFSISPNAVSNKKKFPSWEKITSLILLILAIGVGGFFWLGKDSKQETEEITAPKIEVTAETIDQYLGEILYKKNDQVVELVFSESSLELKRDNKTVFNEPNISFDPTSLLIETPNIKTQYNNSLLSFSDKYPGDTIIFSINTYDKHNVYRFMFTVKRKASDKSLPTPKPQPENSDSKDNPKDDVVKESDTTVVVQFEYDKLEKDDALLLSYFSKVPTVVFNGEEKDACQNTIDEIINVSIPQNNKLSWEIKQNEKDGELSLIFKGFSSKSVHTFIVTCGIKDSKKQIDVKIELLPKKDVKDNVEINQLPEEENVKIDTNYYYKIKYLYQKEDSIVFDYLRIPYFKYGGEMIAIGVGGIDSIVDVTHNDKWNVNHDTLKRQIVFEYNGEDPKTQQNLLIQFYAKGVDFKSNISVDLISDEEVVITDTIPEVEENRSDDIQSESND